MQNKGFIRVFAVLLTLVCLFYLSFSVVTNYYNNKAAEYAGGDAKKASYYLDSLSTEKVWLGYYTLKQCREMEIGLGLDLKGGMNVILEISVADVLKSLSDNNPDVNFNNAIAEATKKQTNSQEDFIKLFVQEYKKIDPNVRLSAVFSTFKLKDKINPNSTNEQVETILRTEVSDAMNNSFNVLRTRIDRFGVVAPNIQKLDREGRILIELPGVKEPVRVRKLLQGSANLEFWETYELSQIAQQLIGANAVVRNIAEANNPAAQVDSVKSITTDSTALATEKLSATDSTATASATKKISATDSIANEINSMKAAQNEKIGSKAAKTEYPLFAKFAQINIQQNGVAPGPVVGTAHYNDTAAINSYLRLKQVRDMLPRDIMFKWTIKAVDEKEQFYQLVALKTTGRAGRPALEGDVVTDASVDFDRTTNAANVSMAMNAEGAKIWARLTKENIGKCVAIVLDDYVYSFPRVNDEITGGRSSISGNFSADEAKDLANVLKSGKMAARVHIVQEDVIGPSLGKEAIQSGMIAFVIAVVLLMTYMYAVYGFIPATISNVAVLLNLFFTMGILASFHAVLTLSGIAGLVLALAVAVDANVLIYERAKEELRNGKPMRKAVTDGFNGAFSAIFDANITSLITGIILFYFGTGPIKGFATTLIIGIVVSFITSVFLTRLAFETGLEKGWIKNLSFTTKISKNMLVHPKYDFIGARKTGYIISAILTVVCLVSFFARGLNEGIEFTGGRNYVVRFEQPVKTQQLEDMLQAEFKEGAITVITIGSSNQVRITTNYLVNDRNQEADNQIMAKLYNGLKPVLPQGTTEAQFAADNIVSFQKVGPSIADDIKTGAMWAIFFATLAMGAYIFLRFRDISFSLGTIASLVHDTVVMVGVYSMFHGIVPFSMEVDQSFIAAILTIIGYSMNDNVVIFDRVREMLHLYPKRNRKEIINISLNTTLSRTFSTSFSTAIVVFCLFLLGGDTIRSFTFAMFIGIIIGTYSTLFVAVPIAYQIMVKEHKGDELYTEDK